MSSAPNFANLSPTIPLPTDANALLTQYINWWQTNWAINTGQTKTLVQSDPIYQMLQTQVALQVLLRGMYNLSFNEGLLPFATGENLDILGAFFGLERSEQEYAVVTLQFTLSSVQTTNSTVPAGTSVSVSGNSALSFATNADLIIPAGQTSGSTLATCNTVGTIGNGFLPGQISALQNWTQPFVVSAVNTDTSTGGADVESDDDFRDAIFYQSETFSGNGTYGGYRQRAINTDPEAIQDVTVVGPESGIVTPGQVYITVWGAGNTAPTPALLTDVYNNVTKYNPFTDQVFVEAPQPVYFNLNVQFYLDSASTTPEQTAINNVVAAANTWLTNTQAKLNRSIDPTSLIGGMYNAGASRVIVIEPGYTSVNPWQIAQVGSGSGSVSITYVTSENDFLPQNL
jgi:phage-related baseplate assembly protein